MTTGAPAALSCTVAMLLLSAARSFVRPIGPALATATSAARWSKLSASSRTQTTMAMENENDKIMYALGAALSGQTEQFKKLLTPEERAVALQGFGDRWLDKPMEFDHTQYAEKVNTIIAERNDEMEKRMAAMGADFIATAAKEEGAVKTESGMVVQTVVEGTGIVPLPTDTVKVHYHGTLVDGSIFDSSVLRGSPISFPLNGVIKGWTEGVQLMKVGGKSKLTIPPELAYGENGTGPIPPNATLVFEVELLAIE